MTYAMADDNLPDGNAVQTGDDFDYYKEAQQKPIPVQVVGSERQRVAKYRSTATVATINNADVIPVQRILGQTQKRHRALVSSRPLATLTIPSVTANTVPQP